MKKIIVDIKRGQFIIYPSGESLDSLVGYINKAYYRVVGQTNQFKLVLINNNDEITLNVITGNVTYQSLVSELALNINEKVNLKLVKYNNAERDYYLIKNETE
jgi:hypothetical protein